MATYNICLIKPDNYVHSYAFLELGELICFSLLELGHQASLKFNTIEANSRNIIIGCHLLSPEWIGKVPDDTVVLNTEQVYSDSSDWNKNIFAWAKNYELWDYSKKNIERFRMLGVNHTKLLQLGFQKELVRISKTVPEDVDVLFYGSMNERRFSILQALESKGLKTKHLFGVYQQERDDWIARSKLILNHHFYNSQIFEVVRVFYLLTNSIAVVGEVNSNTSIDERFKQGICAAAYDELVDRCVEVANNKQLRERLKDIAFNSIVNFPQSAFTKEIIA